MDYFSKFLLKGLDIFLTTRYVSKNYTMAKSTFQKQLKLSSCKSINLSIIMLKNRTWTWTTPTKTLRHPPVSSLMYLHPVSCLYKLYNFG